MVHSDKEFLNGKSSRLVREAIGIGEFQEFRMVPPPTQNVRNSTSSLYSSLYGREIVVILSNNN